MFIIRFIMPSFTNHVLIQQRANINQIIFYVDEIIMESMTNVFLTIGNQIIKRNINNLGYVRRRIFHFTYKNRFHKKVLKGHLDGNNSNCRLVLLSQNMCCTSHCCPIMSTMPKVPLKLQSVHFQNFLSTISTPNRSFKTKIR